MALHAEPEKPSLRSKLHIKSSTSLKVSRVAVFVLLALISVQTVGSALLWYAGKIKADSGSRVVTTSAATSVTTTGADLHGVYDYPDNVTERGFEYGLTTSYGSQVIDASDPLGYSSVAQYGLTGMAGIANDSAGNIYTVGVYGDSGGVIKKYDANGNLVAQFGTIGSGDGQLNGPTRIAVAPSGNIYVVDANNGRIEKFDSDGNYILQWVPYEITTGRVVGADAIAVDASENVYIGGQWHTNADFVFPETEPIVQKYSSTGDYLLRVGAGGGSGNGEFQGVPEIRYMTVDASGNLYVADSYNHRVQKFDSDGNYILQWGALGTGQNEFNVVYGIDVDANGLVYVMDSQNDKVKIFDSNGMYLREWSNVQYGTDLAVNAQGEIYVLNGGIAKGAPSIEASLTGLECDTTYHYRAFATDGVGTTNSADSTFLTEPCTGLRTITTLPADNLGQTTATLHGTTDYPQGITVRGFQYGLTTGYGNTVVDATTLSDIEGTAAIDKSVSGLHCGTQYHFRVFITDRGGTQYSGDDVFSTDACPPMHITTTSLRDGTIGVSYQDYISVQDDTGTVAYSVSAGDLPPGLSLDAGTGFITGIPTQLGTSYFDVTVNDGHTSDTASLSITINDVAPIAITTQSLPDAQLNGGSYYSYQEYIYTENNVSDVDFTIIAGQLPNGLTLSQNGSVGTIEGTPNAAAGAYTFTVQAQDSRGSGDGGTDSKEYTINLPETSQIHITINALPPGRVGSSYDASIGYEFANAQPVFSVVSGNLPPGVSLTLQGYLQGVPTQVGTFSFIVKADDGLNSDSKSLSLVVLPAFAGYDNAPIVKITSPGDNVLFPGGASTISGTGPAGQTISLFVDGTLVGTTVCTSQGKWQYQVAGIAKGSHTLEAKWIPGAEIAFVPLFDASEMRTIIKIYDTSNDVLISQIALPEFSYGVNTAASRSGVVVTGLDMATGTAKVWSINLNSGGVDTIPTDDIFYATSFSPDSKYIYSLGASGGFVKTDFSNLGIQQTQLWPSSQNHVATMHVSEDGATIYAATTNIAFGQLNPSDVLSNNRLGIGKVYVIDAATASVIRTIDVVNNADTNELEYATGLAVAGDIAYIPVVHRSATDTPGTTAESYIKLYNVKTGVFIRQVSVSALSASSTLVPIGGYADIGSDAVYFRGAPITDGNLNSIIKLNVHNDDVSTIELSASESASNMWAWGMGVGGNGTKLYALRNVITGGTPQTLMEVLSLATGSLLNSSGYPINIGGSFSASIQFGQGFIAKITPPKDTITFSVVTASTCTETKTCPVFPSNCASTNTCPVAPPPAVNPPVPASVGTTNPKAPKIVVTPFPPATPATSRLGWFDRGILAVAHFVPRQAAIGFPYLLFLLLLIFALSLYYQSSNEVRKDKLNREFVAKRKAIRAQQDNFIALASHYLNTPITIIQNGIEVMGERGGGPKPK